jgi:hypothetical protein
MLELQQASEHTAFLAQAEVVGRNILKQRIHNGWFVPSQRHIVCHAANGGSRD